jgi:nucleoid DNA-binding protein
MTKREFAKEISKRTGIKPDETLKIVEAYSYVVKETLIKGGHIEIRGFGVFKGVIRKAKLARNISKGTFINVPSKVKPVFVPSKKYFVI